MVRQSAPPARPSALGYSTTGLGFNSIVNSRPSSAISASNAGPSIKHGPVKSDEEDRLGYSGVVERCDSVDLFSPDILQRPGIGEHRKSAIQPKMFELPSNGESPVWRAMPSRSLHQSGSRPSSANVHRQRGIRQNHYDIRKPISSEKDQNGSSYFQPDLREAASRHADVQCRSFTTNGMQKRIPVMSSPKSPLIGQFQTKAEQISSPKSPLVGQLEAKAEQIKLLSAMLQQKEEEQRRVEQKNTILASHNAELQEQVAHLADFSSATTRQSRQRPWSASSAVSSASRSKHALRIPGANQRHQAVVHPNGRWDPTRLGSAYSRKGDANRLSAGAVRSSSTPDKNGLVQMGYNLRGKPVFGFASLEHRSEYAPTEGVLPSPLAADLVVPSGPDDRDCGGASIQQQQQYKKTHQRIDKDDLFARPDAQRHIGSKGHSSHSRPQSANAAIRAAASHAAKHTGYGTARPGSARPCSSYADRLIHKEADDFANFHKLAMSQGEGKQLANILNAMRAKAAVKGVRVVDFFFPFDKLRHGTVSSAEFRRGIETCGCFRDMEESELKRMVELFTAAPGVSAALARVSYAAFCEVLQPVGDRRVRLSEDQKALKDLGQQRLTNSLDSPLCANELSRAGEMKLEGVVRRIVDRSHSCRASIRDLLGPLDSRGRGASTSINSSAGCISRPMFLRGMQNCNLGICFSDEELALLFCKYERNGEFNFFRFVRDLEDTQQQDT